MAAEEDSEESTCSCKLLSTITQTTSIGGANVYPCVPPYGRLPAPLDTAPCMDGVRRRRRGTARGCDANRQKTSHPQPPRAGPRHVVAAGHVTLCGFTGTPNTRPAWRGRQSPHAPHKHTNCRAYIKPPRARRPAIRRTVRSRLVSRRMPPSYASSSPCLHTTANKPRTSQASPQAHALSHASDTTHSPTSLTHRERCAPTHHLLLESNFVRTATPPPPPPQPTAASSSPPSTPPLTRSPRLRVRPPARWHWRPRYRRRRPRLWPLLRGRAPAPSSGTPSDPAPVAPLPGWVWARAARCA